ncbi:MAG TPA: 5-dehydro-4-deoxy-D-glucuronate isomerase [Bacteroidota bacterium]
MEVRYATDPKGFARMSPSEIRSSFLIDTLFTPDTVPMIYSHQDRAIVGSAVPAHGPLPLPASGKEMAAVTFTERREIGVINIGGEGGITVGGKQYPMGRNDCLYVGRGAGEVVFGPGQREDPPRYYFVSFPAHVACPTTHAVLSEAEATPLGTPGGANRRTIYKYIHPKGIRSCQLVMGMTKLEEGSVWNTMPPHTHQRRSEIYLYFNLPPAAAVFHFMGEPGATRHVVIHNGQAVLSPSWSIHAGVATEAYTFIWAMGGENQAFDDMDAVAVEHLA